MGSTKKPTWSAPFKLNDRSAIFDEPAPTANSLLPYAPAYVTGVEWRQAPITFTATLELVTWSRGRSSVTFTWRDVSNGAEYPMFISDVYALLADGAPMRDGRLTGTFEVRKAGQNYGIAYVPNPPVRGKL